MAHPLILAYQETYEKDFPLILVVGREPNTQSEECDNSCGPYDFTEFPRCDLWNTAFRLVAHCNNSSTIILKAAFRDKYRSSPILFTDASPKPILNGVRDKWKVRRSITEQEFKDQAKAIFSHEKVIERVRLILLSGLDKECYSPFNLELKKLALARGKETINIPFFSWRNYNDITDKLPDGGKSVIKDVYEKFTKSFEN